MTFEETKNNIDRQPVGRAVLVVNDRAGSGYLQKINRVAGVAPEFIKSLAVGVLCHDYSKYAVCDLIDHECYMLDKYGK